MPDKSSRMFEVIRKGCGCLLLTVDRIRDPEIAVLVDHLRACSARECFGDRPMLGEIMTCVRVAVMDQA